MLPKKAKNDLNAYPPYEGKQRVKQIMDESDNNTVFHPEGIAIDEIDIEFVKNFKTFVPEYRNRKLNVIWPTVQKWSDFLNTFEIQDNNSNVLRPYCLVQRTKTSKGTKNTEKYTVPNNKLFTYTKIPVTDPDGRIIGADVYQIPQPITIDLTYEVIFSTNNRIEANRFVESLYREYGSLQNYINVKGHYMPISLIDDIFEQSTMIEDEGNYTQKFTFLCKGYVKNKDDFKIIRSVRKSTILI